jgi:CRP-like cAMP-binding protein
MSILHYINSAFTDQFSSLEDLPFRVSTKTFKKSEMLTDYKDIEMFGYFILSGIVQTECLNSAGEVRIQDFTFPNQFVSSYVSFITRLPSKTRITALTDIEVQVVAFEEINELYESSIFVNQLSRKIAEFKVVQKSTRELEFLSLTPAEKYEQMFTGQAEFINQIPSKKLALYLGIQPESLSRIKRRLLKD